MCVCTTSILFRQQVLLKEALYAYIHIFGNFMTSWCNVQGEVLGRFQHSIRFPALLKGLFEAFDGTSACRHTGSGQGVQYMEVTVGTHSKLYQ